MPCAAPSRNNLGAMAPCNIPDVYADGICKWHWQMQNGLIRPSGLDPQTVLLLHGESLTDAAGHGITALGDAKVDSAQGKFGSSYAFDGTGDYLTIPDSEEWNFGAGEWTVDFWIRQPGAPAICIPVANYTGASKSWLIQLTSSTIYLYYSVDGTNALNKSPGGHGPMVAGTWNHIAVVRSGNSLMAFVNGASAGATQDMTGVTFFNSTAPLSIGADGAGGQPVNGWMDEVRISKGIARWTAPFSPPTAPY